MDICINYKTKPLRIESPQKENEALVNQLLNINRLTHSDLNGGVIETLFHMFCENRSKYNLLVTKYILGVFNHFVNKCNYKYLLDLSWRDRTLIIGDYYTVLETVRFLLEELKYSTKYRPGTTEQDLKECGYNELKEFYDTLLRNRVINVLNMNYGELRNDYDSLLLNTGCSYVTDPFEVSKGNKTGRAKVNKYININRIIPEKNNHRIIDVKTFILEDPESADIFFTDYVLKPFGAFYDDLVKTFNSKSPEDKTTSLCDFYSEYQTLRYFVNNINALLEDPKFVSRRQEIAKVSHIDELVNLVNRQLEVNLINIVNENLNILTNKYISKTEDAYYYAKHQAIDEGISDVLVSMDPLRVSCDQKYFVELTRLLFSVSSVENKPLTKDKYNYLKACLCYLNASTTNWTDTVVYKAMSTFLDKYRDVDSNNLTQDEYNLICCNMYLVYKASCLILNIVDTYIKENPSIDPERIKDNINYSNFEDTKLRSGSSIFYKAALNNLESLKSWFIKNKYSLSYYYNYERLACSFKYDAQRISIIKRFCSCLLLKSRNNVIAN